MTSHSTDPVLRSILAAISRGRIATRALAAATEIDAPQLDEILRGERALTIVDVVKLAQALQIPPAELFGGSQPLAIAPAERLAYSMPAFADAVGVSIDTVRAAAQRGDLVVRYPTPAGRKPIITREDGLQWLEQMRTTP